MGGGRKSLCGSNKCGCLWYKGMGRESRNTRFTFLFPAFRSKYRRGILLIQPKQKLNSAEFVGEGLEAVTQIYGLV
jgi:hypothetical protein